MNLYKKVPLVNPTGYPYPPAPSEKENTKVERIYRQMFKYIVCFLSYPLRVIHLDTEF